MATTAVATQTKQTGIATYLKGDAVKANIAGVIGEKNTTRFISSVVSAVQANPNLARCTNQSILTVALQGEALQLPPSPQLGYYYFVGYKNKKQVNGKWVEVEEATFQLGWKGMLQLAIRSGLYKSIVVNEIKEGEIDFNPITEEMVLHPIKDPAVREATETIGYYGAFELMTGFKKQLYLPSEAIKAHAERYSKSYRYDLKSGKQSSIWSTNFDAMAKKTVLRQLLSKWGIMSVEMQQAYTADQGVIDEDGTVRYVDNPNSVPVEVQVQEDIQTNANTEEFVEAEVVEPIKEVAPAPKQKGRPKSKPEEVVAEAPASFEEPEVPAYDDFPDEPDFSK